MQRQLNALRVELSTERSQRVRFETDAERLGQDIDTFRNRNTVLVEELTRSIERVHQAEKQQKVHLKSVPHSRPVAPHNIRMQRKIGVTAVLLNVIFFRKQQNSCASSRMSVSWR
jgi:hypothetical protein